MYYCLVGHKYSVYLSMSSVICHIWIFRTIGYCGCNVSICLLIKLLIMIVMFGMVIALYLWHDNTYTYTQFNLIGCKYLDSCNQYNLFN
jgi:hypothetical protein